MRNEKFYLRSDLPWRRIVITVLEGTMPIDMVRTNLVMIEDTLRLEAGSHNIVNVGFSDEDENHGLELSAGREAVRSK
jgi:hypothetical protein